MLETSTRSGWRYNPEQKSPSCWVRSAVAVVTDGRRERYGSDQHGQVLVRERGGGDERSAKRKQSQVTEIYLSFGYDVTIFQIGDGTFGLVQ